MLSYLSRSFQEEIFARLPGLRAAYQQASGGEASLVPALGLARAYRSLGLLDRAWGWLQTAESHASGGLEPGTGFALALETACWALDCGDDDQLNRALVRLEGWAPTEPEDEHALWAVQVRRALWLPSEEAFAVLERAFRHLRRRPSVLWSARFLAWRALWLEAQGRPEEAYSSAKRALAQAQSLGDPAETLRALVLLAGGAGTPRPKALRAARTAVELAGKEGFPSAEADARAALSGLLAGAKESSSAREFRAAAEGREAERRLRQRWDNRCREEDGGLLGRTGEDSRTSEALHLAEVVARLSRNPDLGRGLEDAYQPLGRLMPSDIFGLALWEPESSALDYSLFIEDGRRTRVGLIPVDSKRSLGAWCFRERKALRINDIDREYRSYLPELSRLADRRPKSMLFQPLTGPSGILGIVTVQSFSRGAYGAAAEAYLAIIASVLCQRLQSEGRPAAG